MSDTANPFREARLIYRERKVDPEGKLPADERRRLAEDADRAHFQEIGKRSGEARRRRAALLEALQRQAVERAAVEPLAS